MIFKDLWILLFLPLITLLLYLVNKRTVSSNIRFSSSELLKSFKPTLKIVLAKNLVFFRLAAAALILLALARPRVPLEDTKIETEGIDIVLAVDSSGSMRAEDFKIGVRRQNRLEAVKDVVEDFVLARKSDRIGMVAFAARAYTVCPLTLDYEWLIKNLERVRIGDIEDGTAVGSAISSSLNRLREAEAKTKIIILLTDGINNAGKIEPLVAAEAAKALGIKIYAIGAGTKGVVPYPMQTPWGKTIYRNVKIEIDEETLKKIAQKTNGKYFRATDTRSLREIYREIDKLEKSFVEEAGFQEYRELFFMPLILGMILLLSEIILSNTILRKLP